MDFGNGLFNPLTLAGLSVMKGNSLGDALAQAALVQQQQAHSQLQQSQAQAIKEKMERERGMLDMFKNSLNQGGGMPAPGAASPAPDMMSPPMPGQSQPDAQKSVLENVPDEKKRMALILASQGDYKAAYDVLHSGERKPGENIDIETKLRGEYFTQSKDWKIINDAYPKIKVAAKEKTAAGDMSLLYGLMKLLDPSTGVKENEYATAQNAGSILERYRNLYNSTINGDKLTPKQREEFVTTANNLYKTQYKNQKAIIKTYEGLAGNYKVNPKNIVVDYRTDEMMGDDSEGEPVFKTQVKGNVTPGNQPNGMNNAPANKPDMSRLQALEAELKRRSLLRNQQR